MSDITLKSRLKGTLYGLVVGDALGAPYEFKGRGTYTVSGNMEPLYTFVRKGDPPMPAGTWTDDTSTALCLAESLNENGKLVWQDVAKKLLSWYKNGYMSAVGYCFDIGHSTEKALEIYSAALQRGERLTLAGSSDPHDSGNGSLMRLAPVPVFYHNKPGEALAMSDLQSQITHASKLCLESCRLATAQMLGFFACPGALSTDERKKKVLDPEYVPGGVDPGQMRFETEEVKALRAGTWKTKSVHEIKTTGFVIHSHEAALWALWNSSTFEEGMLLLLPLGFDVDTVCAIYGQLAGALYGFESIPNRWMDALQKKDILSKVIDTLVQKTS